MIQQKKYGNKLYSNKMTILFLLSSGLKALLKQEFQSEVQVAAISYGTIVLRAVHAAIS
jgi:hypothetical protein